MSDELIEGRSLRGRTRAQIDTTPARAPLPPERLPQVQTATGAQPITGALLDDVAGLVRAAESGSPEVPADFVPRFQTATGEYQRLTSEHIERLRKLVQASGDKPPADLAPQPVSKDPADFIPRFKTGTGEIERFSAENIARIESMVRAAASAEGTGLPAESVEVEDAGGRWQKATPETIHRIRNHLQNQTPPHGTSAPEAVPEPVQFRTSTGELQPITDETIEEIEQAVAAYERGETPPDVQPDWVPSFVTSTGDFERMTMEVLERLAEEMRGESAARQGASIPAPTILPGFDDTTGKYRPLLVEQPGAAVLDAMSDADDWPTGTYARLPSDEEVIEADWVIEIGETMAAEVERIQEREKRARQREVERHHTPPSIQANDSSGPPRNFRTLYYLERIQERVRPWQVISVALALLVIGAVVFVPLALPDGALGDLLGSGGPVVATATPAGIETPGAVAVPPEPTAAVGSVGGMLAFASDRDGNFEIYVLDVETAVSVRLTNNQFDDREPAWSPDGGRIAFSSYRDNAYSIYVMGADGSNLAQVTANSSAMDRSPAWSPDGQWLAFSRETAGGAQIMRMPTACLIDEQPVATCEAALEAVTEPGYALEAAYNHDGTRLAYTSGEFAGLPTAVTLADVDGLNPVPLIGSGTTDYSPAWAPTAARLAFVSNRSGTPDLWVMDADGEGVRQITASASNDVDPAWSPDGTLIAFATDRGDGDFEIVLIDPHCGGDCESALVQITGNDADDITPAWWGN